MLQLGYIFVKLILIMNSRLNSSNEMDINLNSSNSFIVMTVLPDEQWKLDIVSVFSHKKGTISCFSQLMICF